MTDIFFPVSTTTLSDLPILSVDPNDINNEYVVSINTQGFTGKTSISSLKTILRPKSLADLNGVPFSQNKILGRYSLGDGGIEEITLGPGFSISNGVLNSSLSILGNAGGDFQGVYPNPTIRSGAVTLDKLEELQQGEILGRYSPGVGSPQKMTFSSDFSIDNNTGEISLISENEISSTGFIINNVNTINVVASPTNIYYCGEKVETIQITSNNLGDQIMIFKYDSLQSIAINFPNNDVLLMDSNAIHLVCDGEGEYHNLLF